MHHPAGDPPRQHLLGPRPDRRHRALHGRVDDRCHGVHRDQAADEILTKCRPGTNLVITTLALEVLVRLQLVRLAGDGAGHQLRALDRNPGAAPVPVMSSATTSVSTSARVDQVPQVGVGVVHRARLGSCAICMAVGGAGEFVRRRFAFA